MVKLLLLKANKNISDACFCIPANQAVLLFAYSYSITITCGDNIFELVQGSAALIGKNDIKVVAEESSVYFSFILENLEQVEGIKQQDWKDSYSVVSLGDDYELFANLCKKTELLKNQEEVIEIEAALCESFINNIVLLFVKNNGLKSESISNLTENVKKYIYENYNKEITLTTLAQSVFVSNYYLAHKFKEDMGISPIQFLINHRISKARELLLETDKTISEISSLIGYENVNYFNLLFKKVMGINPGKYRKQFRAKEKNE